MKFTVGSVVGKMTKTALVGVGCLTACVGKISTKLIKNEEKREVVKEKTDKVSNILKEKATPISNKLGYKVDEFVIQTGEFTGKVSKDIAKRLNVSDENVRRAEKIGEMCGKVAVGGVIGLTASVAVTSTVVATGGSGSAITASLAALGGGSVATGGAGMAGGLIVVQAIATTTTAVSVTATSLTKREGGSENKEIAE